VQLARWRGAKVIGTGPQYRFRASAGVDRAIDYSITPFENVVRCGCGARHRRGRYQERSWGVLKPGGMLVSPLKHLRRNRCYVRRAPGDGLFNATHWKSIDGGFGLVDAGQIKPHVSTVLPLEKSKKDTQWSKAGTRGQARPAG
jgi:NADPH:quinone reductase-like Zn-dependent oxidoreductase